ncbi:MAG: hypothetical protein INR71_14330, partial [Terriglobus roseus]|nr:hypothetical protein [Terriglobus roseus]
MPSRKLWFAAVTLAALSTAIPVAAQSPAAANATSSPAMQLPPDQAAFQTANALIDQQKRIAALDAFLHQYPQSKRAGRARSVLLALLLQQQPADEKRIHQIAKSSVDSAGKDSRANEENSVAYSLAEAPPNGVDLKSAEAWARDSVKLTTVPAITATMGGESDKSKPPSPAEQAKRDAVIREIYNETEAANLQTLADVYFHEGKLADATSAVEQAEALSPKQGANFLTRGQIEHAQHQDSKALDDLETAEVYGGMTPAGEVLLHTLYAAQHTGDQAGLDVELDRRYLAAYQPVPTAQHPAFTAGRTVLLALYTGSACDPCAAADLATDGILHNYSRSEVVALAFDQHIPDPDPLANTATIARAAYDGVRFTPTLRIDGAEAPQIGGRRPDTEKSYKVLSAALDKELSTPSGATLHLIATLTPAHKVEATAELRVTDSGVLANLLAAASKPGRNEGATASASSETATPRPSAAQLVLNFALVQREVRYSGENGIRFHSMVVRDLAKPTADAFPVKPDGT